jgi:hypothetical protein
MPSTYDSLLRLELQATGENDNTWGEKANENFELIGEAIAGFESISVAGSGNYTLSTSNAATDQARKAFLTFTGLLTGSRTIIIPSSSKTYIIRRATTGSHTLTVKTAAGTGVDVAANATVVVACDGTDCFSVAGATSTSVDLSGYMPLSGGTMSGTLAIASGTTSSPGLTFSGDTDTGLFRPAANIMALSTNGVERMRFNSGGAFLVGLTTSTPTSADPGLHMSPAGQIDVRRTSTADYYVNCIYNTTLVGGISPNGTTGVTFNTTSDYRLKAEVSVPAGFAAKLEALKVREYIWKSAPQAPSEYGFFAHELQAVWPQAVTGEKDGEVPQQVDYGRVTPLLLGALQEALAKIADLEARVARLEST